MTTWSPDTCNCQIDFSDDGNTTYIGTRRACIKHVQHGATPAHLNAVLAHNRKKNAVLNVLIAQGIDAPDVGYDPNGLTDDEPVLVRGLKQSDIAKNRGPAEAAAGGASGVRFL